MITILGDFLRKNWRFLKNHCYDFFLKIAPSLSPFFAKIFKKI
jgi:hypothetical protein